MLSDILLKSLDELTSDQQHDFSMLLELEGEAVSISDFLISSASRFAGVASRELMAKLSVNNELTEEQKSQVESIFGKTVINSVAAISPHLANNFKEGKGFLFNAMLSERVIKVLDSILEFEKTIDEKFPGLSDMILKLSSVAITTVVTLINPTAGLCLKASGALSKVTDFLKTDNLEATLGQLKEKYEHLEQDKVFSKAVERAKKITDISSSANVSSLSLLSANINDTALDIIKSNITNLQVKEFLSHTLEYSEQYIPHSKQEIHAKTNVIKETIIAEMQKNNVASDVIKRCEATIEQSIKEANKTLETSLITNKGFFDKIVAQQKATKCLLDLSQELDKTLEKAMPGAQASKKAIVSAVILSVKENIQGPVEKIQSDTSHNVNAKIAKEMGANAVTKVIIESSINQFNKAAGVGVNTSGLRR